MKDLTELFPQLLVRANAGTGKTYQLSTRYISLIAAGELPEHILATTFTRKAAWEIAERVFRTLAGAARDPARAQELASDTGQPGLTQAQALALLQKLVASQHRLAICTLDSLCYRLAGAFSLELGLPPGWRTADETADVATVTETVRKLCTSKYASSLTRLLPLFRGGVLSRSIQQQIEDELPAVHQLFRQTEGSAWSWLDPGRGLSEQELEAMVQQLLKLPLPKTKADTPLKAWVDAVAEAADAIERRDWKAFIAKGLAKNILEGKSDFARASIPPEIADLFNRFLRHARTALLTVLKAKTEALYELLSLYDREYEQQRLNSRTLGFDDIKWKLTQAALSARKDDLYYRLDGRIKHLLLDEFQDTSAAEWHVIAPLADEILSKANGEYSFFCVGDVKQAIYGWRGGRAEIFDTLQERFSQLKPQLREKSYRSSLPVIETINKIFSDLPSNPVVRDKFAEAAAAWSRGFARHSSAKPQLPGYACLQLVRQSAPENGALASQNQEEGNANDAVVSRAVGLVQELHSAAPNLSIGVLVRKNSSVARLIYELRKPQCGIPASEEGGNPLNDSPAVCALLSLLTLAEHPGDTLAAYHVASSPLGTFFNLQPPCTSHSVQLLSWQLRHQLFTVGLGPCLHSWSQQLVPYSSTRDQRRLAQLVELGHAWSSGVALRTSEFIRMVRQKRVEDPIPSLIRVMTVHQAKGLEFDITILPDLDFSLLSTRPDPLLIWQGDPCKPPRYVSRYASEQERLLDPTLKQMYDQQNLNKIKESLSVLYVALTRPRHALYLLAAHPETLPRSSVRYASILLSALAPDYQQRSSELVYECGDPAWIRRLPPPEHSTEESHAPGREIVLAASPSALRRMLPRLTPSSLEGSASVTLASLLRLPARAALQRGRYLHLLFSKIHWLREFHPNASQLLQSLLAQGADAVLAQEVVDEFLSSLELPAVREIFATPSAPDGSTPVVYQELPFAMREGDAILSGTFDRLVLWRHQDHIGKVQIIDFKTDRIEDVPGGRVSDRVDFYRPQMLAYRRAAARYAQVDEGMVSMTLLFTHAGQAINVG